MQQIRTGMAIAAVVLLLGMTWSPYTGLHHLSERQQWIFLRAANTEPCNLRIWKIIPYYWGGPIAQARGTYGYIYGAGLWTDDELWCITRHECKEEQKWEKHTWEYVWNECWEEGMYE